MIFDGNDLPFDREETVARMHELCAPIEQQILMCDSNNDLLMMASVMLQRTTEIYSRIIGEEGAAIVLEGIVDKLRAPWITELDRCKWSQFTEKLTVWKKKDLKDLSIL